MTRDLVEQSEQTIRTWMRECNEAVDVARRVRDRQNADVRLTFRNALRSLRGSWGDPEIFRFVQMIKGVARTRLAEVRAEYEQAERDAWHRYTQLSEAERERMRLQIGG